MNSVPKHHNFYLETLKNVSELSYAKRKKVGCVIIKDGNILSYGYNGTPSGFENVCEDQDGNTKPEVIHAEMNAIAKLANSGVSSKDAVLYVTMSPCSDCAKLIIQSGIKTVFYLEEYRKTDGIQMLEKANIRTEKI